MQAEGDALGAPEGEGRAGGALFSLITTGECDPGYIRELTKSMVDGVLGG